MLSIVFLIFDVELILIFPIIPAFSNYSSIIIWVGILLVILILVVGLYHEAAQGSLAWAEWKGGRKGISL